MVPKFTTEVEVRFQKMIIDWCTVVKNPNTAAEYRLAVLYLLYRHHQADLSAVQQKGHKVRFTYQLKNGECYQCEVFPPISI